MTKQLPCGVSFMRAILLLLNIIFVLVGLFLIGLGIYIKIDTNFAAILDELTKISSFESQSLGFFAYVLIGGGVLTLLIALCGCLGSLWNKRCLLYLYAIILGIMMILELVAVIMAIVYKSKLESVYKGSLQTAFYTALGRNDTKFLEAFHRLESSLKCCGVNGPTDYGKPGTPQPDTDCFLRRQGCSNAIMDLLNKNLPIIGGCLGAVLVLELLGLIGAIVLAVALKNPPDDPQSSDPKEVLSELIPGRRRNYRKM